MSEQSLCQNKGQYLRSSQLLSAQRRRLELVSFLFQKYYTTFWFKYGKKGWYVRLTFSHHFRRWGIPASLITASQGKSYTVSTGVSVRARPALRFLWSLRNWSFSVLRLICSSQHWCPGHASLCRPGWTWNTGYEGVWWSWAQSRKAMSMVFRAMRKWNDIGGSL